VLDLAERGVISSSGSACAAGSDEPSHVLVALGTPREVAHTAVRFTLGRGATADEAEQAAATICEVLTRPCRSAPPPRDRPRHRSPRRRPPPPGASAPATGPHRAAAAPAPRSRSR